MKDRRSRKTFYLLLPNLVVTVLFVLVPVIGMVIFSLLRLEHYAFKPDLTFENYSLILADGAWIEVIINMLRTLGMLGVVLALVLIGAYPIAYLLARKVKNPGIQMAILLLCITPFWTSYIIRMVTWVPLLANEGIVNSILLSLGIIKEPLAWLLFSARAVIIVEFFLWIVFLVAPIFWVIARIPNEVMEASLNLGATRLKRFLTITLPMSVPGMAVGIMFVLVIIMGDFATPSIIGGGRFMSFSNHLKNYMVYSEFGIIGAYSVFLMATSLFLVYLLFRAVDLRKEL